jgi:DNA-binding response OmpR family regulator
MAQARRVLVIEDEAPIRRGVIDALRASGYEAAEAADGDSGLAAAMHPRLDLVLLDLRLPKRDGMELLGELRRVRPALPVVILTARGAEQDRVLGLKRGADDYVVKPFSARELLARVEAVLRRCPNRSGELQSAQFGRATADLARREIRWPGDAGPQRCELSDSESTLLGYLLANRDRVVTRDELLARLWGLAAGAETRTIDMHITRLRQKLRQAAGTPASEAIVTVRGRGYMAAAEWRESGR